MHILDFKTKWSEFQKLSQTAAEQGEAKLRILDFEITWLEFQMPSQTASAEAKPRCVYLNNYFNFHVCLSFLYLCVHVCLLKLKSYLTPVDLKNDKEFDQDSILIKSSVVLVLVNLHH